MESTEQTKLKKQLSSRHITMLALGGAIGAGLFKGSGEAIGIAGPAVLLAFLIGGGILFIVMSGLGKLVLDGGDTQHGLSGLIRPYLGNHSADFVDWVYYSMWMINIIAEAVAAASFLQLWFPHVPAWCFILLLAILTTLINLYSVRLFAETEYWLAFAKISVIILMILFGLYLVGQQMLGTGIFPTLSQLTDHGGFTPHGLKGVVSSLLVVIYSYGGSELIAITVSEADDPKKAIPKAIKGVMGRIVSFYIIPLFLLLILFPWNTLAGSAVSPFVLVFEQMNIPFASDIVNFVIVLALFSSINSGVYASSRLLFFRLKDKKGTAKKLAKLNKHYVPQRAVLFCTSVLYLGVILSYFVGDKLFGYLAGSLSYTVLVIWLMISAAAFRLALKKGTWQAKSFNLFALIALSLILIGILMTNSIGVTVLTALLYAVIFFSYQKKKDVFTIKNEPFSSI
ncbi:MULTISPECIES: amino acid permease [Enterococcus]|uniref:Amino acid permease n=2 Tax=Enterococcus mundtii TaxID=53346 RepID=A0AAI8R858_ENTMU|nr:amino acid permease [Enterococcus mundtii]EOH63631.1 amino acid permease [Enterococcus mundtii ATCC 882]EOU13388.1 amino acid permease [Enterococcus mundtii ATCC 882]MBE9909848.1 amino acid permease [Enterococcus mundtii]MCA6773090.1 amino acid permease [Enterococcus mundtii]PJK26942.1 amino acid permease [Enterococcus mundtii]